MSATASRASDPGAAVLAGLDSIRDRVESFYKDLHAHPELGLQEHRTAERVAERLRRWGYQVTDGIGGTGVVGVLSRGAGPTVLLRADMDALPVEERTGLPYASTATAVDGEGKQRPVMHACGHDTHVTCLLACAWLMAQAEEKVWQGTLVVLFQPSEENGDGATAMIQDGLTARIPAPDVALAQHVLPYPAGTVGTRPGPVLSAADSFAVLLHGRGSHGSQPQTSVDPVVLAAAVTMRLQTVVSRELAATTPAVVTVGAINAGDSPNVIPDRAELKVNVRTYDEGTRRQVLDAVERIVGAECTASRSPKEPEFTRLTEFPPTVNDEAATERVAKAFAARFGDRAGSLQLQAASEDFSEIPKAFGVPYTFWGFGGTDPGLYAEAMDKGTLTQDVPVNHSPYFAPVLQPTLDTGITALVTAALAWLGPGAD